MAKFRMVHTEFWSDPTIMEEFTPEDKFFFLYLLTNNNTKQIGIYEITKKQMAFEMGYSIETINSLLDRFLNHHKLVRYNPETREIAIKNWGRYNLNRGGKPVIDCVTSELREVKDVNLIFYVSESINNSAIKALYDTYNDTSTTRGQEEEEEEEEEKEEEKEKERVPSDSSNQTTIPYKEIIDYLNLICNTKYRAGTKKTQSLIKARWNEGFRVDDFKEVISKKSSQWLNNADMQKYLRPETLFGTKFEGYLNEIVKTPRPNNQQRSATGGIEWN